MYRAWTRRSIEEIAREVWNEMNGNTRGGNTSASTSNSRSIQTTAEPQEEQVIENEERRV